MSLSRGFPFVFNSTNQTNQCLKAHDNELNKLYTDINDNMTATGHAHTGNGSDGAKISALNIINVPSGSISSTDVQSAINELNTEKLSLSGGTLSGAVNEKQGSNAASATTVNIGAASGNFLRITGTTTITGFDTIQAGARRIVVFSDSLILTHNATKLILPGNSNIVVSPGDRAQFTSLGAGNWHCDWYTKADGQAVINNIPAISSTAQAQAGTDNTTMLTPLRMREGFNACGNAPVYACRAWVNFNGTGTVAIRASGNVSSITDNGVGDYTINLTTVLPDTNYAWTAGVNAGRTATVNSGLNASSTLLKTASALRFVIAGSGSYTDASDINIAIFR